MRLNLAGILAAASIASTGILPTNGMAIHGTCKADARQFSDELDKRLENLRTPSPSQFFIIEGIPEGNPPHQEAYVGCFLKELDIISKGRYKGTPQNTPKGYGYKIIVRKHHS